MPVSEIAGPPELVVSVSRSRAHWKWTTLAERDGECSLGVGDEEALVEGRGAVLGDAAVVDGGGGVVAVGLLEVLPEEARREMGLVVELVVEPREEDVLLDVAAEGAELLGLDEVDGRGHWVVLMPGMVRGIDGLRRAGAGDDVGGAAVAEIDEIGDGGLGAVVGGEIGDRVDACGSRRR